MKKIAAALALAGLGMAPLAAFATVEYKFFTSQISCVNPAINCNAGYWTDVLGSLSISLTSAPAHIRTATQSLGDWPDYYDARGFHIADFSRIGAEADPWTSTCIPAYYRRCGVIGEFDLLFTFLIGSLNVFSDVTDLYMSSSSGGPTWTGYFYSDSPMTSTTDGSVPVFEGVWRAVPEPSPVVLIGAGLAGLMFMRRRKS